jgi:hypothetical protein
VNVAPLRDEKKRNEDAAFASLQVVDSYFGTILHADVDDCGKKLVCEIQTIAEKERTVEEMLVR